MEKPADVVLSVEYLIDGAPAEGADKAGADGTGGAAPSADITNGKGKERERGKAAGKERGRGGVVKTTRWDRRAR